MLTWVFISLGVAIIASLFGFGLIASAFAGVARILAIVAAAAFVVTLVVHFLSDR